jgi:hypothetical protein
MIARIVLWVNPQVMGAQYQSMISSGLLLMIKKGNNKITELQTIFQVKTHKYIKQTNQEYMLNISLSCSYSSIFSCFQLKEKKN